MMSRLGGMLQDAMFGLPLKAERYIVHRDLTVPMPDGVELLGDHYRPTRPGGQQPVVLIRLPYGRAGALGQTFAAPLARRGFQVFIQSTRGTFGSGGHFRPLTGEQEDGLATVRWLREQPWCDGRIAMSGMSYFGHTQWAVAPYVDPPLVAIAPTVTAAQFSTVFHRDGAPLLDAAVKWTGIVGRQEFTRLQSLGIPNPAQRRRVARALEMLPLQAVDLTVAGTPVNFWRDWVDHAEPGDDYWAESADHHHADYAALPPTSMVTGWWDVFLPGQLADFAALRSAGVPGRLVVGPWQHTDGALIATSLQTTVAWLDHHLRGGPAPDGAAVRIYLQQADEWREFDEWPPSIARPVPHYLASDGLLAVSPKAETPPSTFTYDPAEPTPSVGGPLLETTVKQADAAHVEQRPDVLVFTGDPLTTDLDVIGPVRAQVHLRSELEHLDVVVRLCDVDEKGVSRTVVEGVRRVDPRALPADHIRIGQDDVLAVDVDLYPTAYRFAAGHRLRVHIAGGAFPRYARNHGTGAPLGTAHAMRTNRIAVVHDADHPSHLSLSIL